MTVFMFAVLAVPLFVSANPDAGAARGRFLSPKEMMKLLEESPRQYRLTDEKNPVLQWTQQNAMLAWPGSAEALMVPRLETRADGKRVAVESKRRVAAQEMSEKVEPLWEAKQWAEAEKGYGEIVEKFPDDYWVLLDHGDAALFAGKAAVALARYERATKLNPDDHRSWYYRGNALAKLGRKKEALDAWAHAIAMRPGYEVMLQGLEPAAAQLGYQVRARSFLPSARVTPIEGGFEIAMVVQPQWVAWGVCKAMWLGEPDHRRELTGSEERARFSSIEERECLAHLGSAYDRERKKGAIPRDAIAEHVLAVIDAKLIDGYLLWEIASRVDPHIYIVQPPALQREVEAYVRRFILVPQ